MLISVCKMIRRIRERSPWDAPAKGRHAWRWKQIQWLPFCSVSILAVKGVHWTKCCKHPGPAQFIKHAFLLLLCLLSLHVTVFFTIMFFKVRNSCQRIALWKKNIILVIILFFLLETLYESESTSLNYQYVAPPAPQIQKFYPVLIRKLWRYAFVTFTFQNKDS